MGKEDTKKQRRTSSSASKESAMAIARVSSCRSIKNHRNDNSFQFNKNAKRSAKKSGHRKSTASSEEKRNNNGVEQKDKSLQGTTTGTCDTSDQNETSIETNSRQRTISKGGQATTRRERRIENRTKESHNLDYNENNSNIKTTKHRRHGVGYFLIIDQNKDTQR